MTTSTVSRPTPQPARNSTRRPVQRGWALYDVANSAFATSLVSAIAGPYLLSQTKQAAVDGRVSVLGLHLPPGAFVAYLTTFSVLLQLLILPLLGSVVDATGDKRRYVKVSALIGAALCGLLAVLPSAAWLASGLVYALANVAFGASIAPYNALLSDIADESERDRVSAKGFAYGYAGGGILLAVNLAFLQLAPNAFGISKNLAVRLDIASVGLWWAAFTMLSMSIMKKHLPAPVRVATVPEALRNSLRDLKGALGDLRRYPDAGRYLGSFLLWNDAIQGVIGLAGVFIVNELFTRKGLSDDDGTAFVIILVLIIQACAIPGALLFARLADRIGTQRAIITSLVLWMAIVAYSWLILDSRAAAIGVSISIALVLGGSQALARSIFTKMIPAGRENAWLGLMATAERGTSWIAPLLFGIALSVTGSYRLGLASLLLLFIVGTAILLTSNSTRAIALATATHQPDEPADCSAHSPETGNTGTVAA